MPALVSSPAVIISSASMCHCLHNQSALHSRQDEGDHHASRNSFRACWVLCTSPKQRATRFGPGLSSLSSTRLQPRDERRSLGNRITKICTLLSVFDVDVLWVRMKSEDAEQQTFVSPVKRFMGFEGNAHAVVMTGRRIFLSMISSYVASVSCIGVTSATPASAIPDKNKAPKSTFNEKRSLEQNKRMQQLNNAPADFPTFVREGFNVKVLTTEKYVKCDSGLIYLDIQEGHGDQPKDGQQITFHYIGFNESGRRVDSTYQQGRPAKTRVGINAMIPGFEEGVRTMKPGGKRRIVVPPELGPPIGPSTFFSAKQFEVFDVELLDAKDCIRRTIGFYSDVLCE